MDQTPNPVPSYIAALLRTLGGAVGGYMIAKGYIKAEDAPALGGFALTVIVAGWGLYQKIAAHKALKAAVAAPAGEAS